MYTCNLWLHNVIKEREGAQINHCKRAFGFSKNIIFLHKLLKVWKKMDLTENKTYSPTG